MKKSSSYSDGRGRKRVIGDVEIAEYLAKKALKKASRVAKKMKVESSSAYSNENNPFRDPNLSEKIVWRKKIEHDVVNRGVPLESFSMKAEKKRERERIAEMEKVKARRERKAVEKNEREELAALLAKQRSMIEFVAGEKKEEDFEFKQSRLRSLIRLSEGRMKPIDILINHLQESSSASKPCNVFKGLRVDELEELRGDLKLHLDMNTATPGAEDTQYWKYLLVVCDWELAEAQKSRVCRGKEQQGVHSSVETDVKNILQGKSYAALESLQSSIESQMRSGTALVVEYWEAVLQNIEIYKARAYLKENHAGISSERDSDEILAPRPLSSDTETDENPGRSLSPEPESYSPNLHGEDTEDSAIDPEEDRSALEKNRMNVIEEQQSRITKAMGRMGEGDAIFGNEINLDKTKQDVYWWHDKYRPRKPVYLNRVHSGYEWNKYNQVHYDSDRPPPQIVQGYKFNIFYPDLIDNRKTPVYSIEKDGDSASTCIIRFHAGPPYEDLAFRIVNREWEYSHKKGFVSAFQHGTLQLYFNFKRYRYRR